MLYLDITNFTGIASARLVQYRIKRCGCPPEVELSNFTAFVNFDFCLCGFFHLRFAKSPRVSCGFLVCYADKKARKICILLDNFYEFSDRVCHNHPYPTPPPTLPIVTGLYDELKASTRIQRFSWSC